MRRLHLPIQNPCHENWDAMGQETDARRFCDVCAKSVHDLSAMTETEARTVLADESAKGRVCVRYKADGDGNIKFKPWTVTAQSLWRMTLAAAGMTLALLSGCTDSEPDRVLADHCEYEVGPWGFTVPRGQGTCPAVPEEPEVELVGEIAIDPPPPPPVTHEVKGDIGPEPRPTMGEAPMIEPPVAPEPMVMGKIAPVEVEVPVERELMGDVAVAPDKPCDPPSPPPSDKPGPRRL